MDKISDEDTVSQTDYSDRIFYKKKWIKEKKKIDGVYQQMETQLIVSFSLKYMKYQEMIRGRQIERALKAVVKGKAGIEKKRPTDYKRFIKADHATADGEVADKTRCILRRSSMASIPSLSFLMRFVLWM